MLRDLVRDVMSLTHSAVLHTAWIKEQERSNRLVDARQVEIGARFSRKAVHPGGLSWRDGSLRTARGCRLQSF